MSIAMHFFQYKLSQSAITCSNLTIETLDQGEICSELTIKTPGPHQQHRSGVLLLTLDLFHTF